MCARNVRELSRRASRAKSASLKAEIGALCTIACPRGSNVPRPVPSGLRWLWTVRLSGASSSQNSARSGWAPPLMPNKRHISAMGTAPGAVRVGGGLLSQYPKRAAQVVGEHVDHVAREVLLDHHAKHADALRVGR